MARHGTQASGCGVTAAGTASAGARAQPQSACSSCSSLPHKCSVQKYSRGQISHPTKKSTHCRKGAGGGRTQPGSPVRRKQRAQARTDAALSDSTSVRTSAQPHAICCCCLPDRTKCMRHLIVPPPAPARRCRRPAAPLLPPPAPTAQKFHRAVPSGCCCRRGRAAGNWGCRRGRRQGGRPQGRRRGRAPSSRPQGGVRIGSWALRGRPEHLTPAPAPGPGRSRASQWAPTEGAVFS